MEKESEYIIPTDRYLPLNFEDIKGMIDGGNFKYEPQFDGNGNLISIDIVRTDRYEKRTI